MGIKSIISSIAFVGAFTLSSGLAWLWQGPAALPESKYASPRVFSKTTTQTRISEFLQQDIANGQVRQMELRIGLRQSDEAGDFKTIYARVVANYVNAAVLLDDTALPDDFQTAWRAHRAAWQQYGACLRWEARAAGSKSKEPSQCDANDEINRTWAQVNVIAYRYGAEVIDED